LQYDMRLDDSLGRYLPARMSLAIAMNFSARLRK
jgi:hypothetical protein